MSDQVESLYVRICRYVCRLVWRLPILSAMVLVSACGDSRMPVDEDDLMNESKQSSFGVYSGYSEPLFNSFTRESVYVTVEDGTRIAVDIFRPATDGLVAEKPLPVALWVTRYWRAREIGDGSIMSLMGHIDANSHYMPLSDSIDGLSARFHVPHTLARHGYVVMVMDSRGTGASFGIQTPALDSEKKDMRDVMAWIDQQEWSTGKVGMFGWSWPGLIQILAASEPPPQLAAIVPAVPNFLDYYRRVAAGGVFRKASALTMRHTLVNLTEVNDAGQTSEEFEAVDSVAQVVGVARVDEDVDGSLRAEARSLQGGASFAGYIEPVVSHPVMREVVQTLELESVDSQVETLFHAAALDDRLDEYPALRASLVAAEWSLPPNWDDEVGALLERIREASVPAYLWDGWQDAAPSERLLYFFNLDSNTKLTIGPWSHGPNEPDDLRETEHVRLAGIEILRWFDYWLKGVDNGILQEPRINYAVAQDKEQWEWRTASTFPPPESTATDFFFAEGKSGSIGSINDGLLTHWPSGAGPATDEYVADYTLSVGPRTRHHDVSGGGPILYDDLAPNDAKALTYTTAPLLSDLAIAGFPIVTFYASSTADKLNFIVYLEEVDANGRSTLVTQGAIRSSHRAIKSPFYDTNGVPWTSSAAEDIDRASPLTEGPVEIRLALEPVANLFDRGNRIRVAIANADENLVLTFPIKPRPVTSVWRDADHPSRLTVDVLPGS